MLPAIFMLSCSKERDDNSNTPISIVAKWHLVHFKSETFTDGERTKYVETTGDQYPNSYVYFRKDGTALQEKYHFGTPDDIFKYRLNNDELQVYDSYTGNELVTYKVTLTANTLKLHVDISYASTDPGKTGYIDYEFEKVSDK